MTLTPVGAPVGLGGSAIAKYLADAGLAVPHDDHRMDDQHGLAGRVGDFAQDRIEQERHVVVDDGDDRDRLALPDQAGIGIDGDNAARPCCARPTPRLRAARRRSSTPAS